jgi:glutamyl-tRNA synthetase
MDHNLPTHKPIVTRIPPSPTGRLHIGTVRTALFNYLFAKHYGGTMVFRSEDTDKARSTKESEDEIISGLLSLGLTWSNTESVVRQSERGTIYKEQLEHIIAAGTAYISTEPSKADETKMVSVIRLKNPNKDITFHDLIRGDITFNTTELGDIVIARSIDDALYHFTVVVDDELMGVTHVIRGEDHISNTPRQILIQEALGYTRPVYAHLPLILAPDRSKMSKRHGAVAIKEYQAEGFLDAAIINYMALMGWNPGTDRELFTLPELIEAFTIEHVQKSGAVFNREKFLWYNRTYLDQLPAAAFAAYLAPAVTSRLTDLPQYSDDRLAKLLPTIRERISVRSEFTRDAEAGEYDFAFATPHYETGLLRPKNVEDITLIIPHLEKLIELLTEADFSSPESIKQAIWSYAEAAGKANVLWPMRTALSGKAQSPDPFTIAHVIGQQETRTRLTTACDKISSNGSLA